MTLDIDEKNLERWTKIVGLIAALVYICGYLIITIRNANFGFYASDLIKPRILASGATFSLFCILPSYFANKTLPDGKSGTIQEFATRSVALLAYLVEMNALVYLTSLFIHAEPLSKAPARLHVRDVIAVVAILLIISLAFFLIHRGARYIERWPRSIALCSLVCFGLALWNQSNRKDDSSATNVWLIVVGLIGCWLYRKGLRGEIGFSQVAFLLYVFLIGTTYYADLVFPHIYQRWGGGHAVPIALSTYDKDANKLQGFVNADLIDEDSNGIFVQYANKDVAVLVPKDSISRVCYLERAQPHYFAQVLMPSLLVYGQTPQGAVGCSPTQ